MLWTKLEITSNMWGVQKVEWWNSNNELKGLVILMHYVGCVLMSLQDGTFGSLHLVDESYKYCLSEEEWERVEISLLWYH